MDMYLFNKEHLGSQMHSKNDCCMTEEQGMDIYLRFLKHPKNLHGLRVSSLMPKAVLLKSPPDNI